MEPEFYGKMKDGVYADTNPKIFEAYCKGQPDGDYCKTLKKVKVPKTPAQLAYYYAVIVPAAYKQMKADGNHTFIVRVGKRFKEVKLTEDIVDKTLKDACKVGSKARMSKKEAEEFIERSILWCAKWLSCVIPPADKEWYMKKSRVSSAT